MNEKAFEIVHSSLSRRRQVKAPAERTEPTQQEIKELFEERITPETELPPMQPLFKMFDVPCFYRGELVANCGKAKSGKTFFLSILMAGALKSQMLTLERLSEDPLTVLWIDTEQSQQSTQEILKDRVLRMIGATESRNDGSQDSTINSNLLSINSKVFAFNLRGLGFEKRNKMVDVAIRTIKPDIAIIDGVKDLMTDINDAVQATLIMEKLMALAKEQNCCIVCVLHLNKSEQDRNMRGSIGTELTNKAFEVFQCQFIDESDTFKVSHTYSRKQKMKRKFYYRVNDEGLPVVCEDYQEQPRDERGRWMSTKVHPEADVDLVRLFKTAMEGRKQRPFNELMAVALKKCGVIDAQSYYEYFHQAEEQEIICKKVHPDTGATWVELKDNSLPF